MDFKFRFRFIASRVALDRKWNWTQRGNAPCCAFSSSSTTYRRGAGEQKKEKKIIEKRRKIGSCSEMRRRRKYSKWNIIVHTAAVEKWFYSSLPSPSLTYSPPNPVRLTHPFSALHSRRRDDMKCERTMTMTQYIFQFPQCASPISNWDFFFLFFFSVFFHVQSIDTTTPTTIIIIIVTNATPPIAAAADSSVEIEKSNC